jgi:RNA polymerase sigma-70 factor (ECF subfamily)
MFRGMSSSLVDRARGGDAAAMEELLAGVAPAVQRFGRRMCQSEHDADDVVQDTLINIATHLDQFEGRASLSSWAFALARSACSRRRRGLKNRPPVADDAAAERVDPAPTPEQHVASAELGSALSQALDALSDDHREVILLRDVEGLTAPEASAALGVSVDAVKSRLHRARAALRDALRPVLEPEPAPPPAGDCPDVVELWSRYADGELGPEDCAAMERHLQNCPSCGAACQALKSALGACRAVRQSAVPPTIQEHVRRALNAWAAEQG